MSGAFSLLVGLYLAIVVWRGNTRQFASLFSSDFSDKDGQPGFLKWFVAVSVVWYLSQNAQTRSIGYPLAVMTVLGFFYSLIDSGDFEKFKQGVADGFAALSPTE
jgi:hypothetical protein